MKPFTIRAETSMLFEIEYQHEGKPTAALLEMKHGAWQITPPLPSGVTWIARRDVEWPEALKRALVALGI